jgi:hypothetical protein
MTEPQIFTVHVFRPVENNCFRLDVHYVVGLNSADAEERIKREDGQHIEHGARFILTDAHMTAHPRSCQLYTTRHRNEDAMPAHEFSDWLRRMTKPHCEEGDVVPAAFRRF